MKKILCALLACLMLTAPVLTACNDSSSSDTTTTTTTTTPQGDPEPEPDPDPKDAKYKSITLGGVDISEYQIVYAPDSFADIKNQPQYVPSFTIGETHYEKIIAEELAADIKNMTGIDVPVVPSTAAASANEILIGRTGRTSAEDSRVHKDIANDICKILWLETGKLWMMGGSPAAMYDTLNQLYTEFFNQGVEDVSITDMYYLEDHADVITVSCIGDSITDGFNGGYDSDGDGKNEGTSNGYISWPAVAQRILWKEYVFTNFGVSGMTMRDDHKDAYKNCSKYPEALAAAPYADITIIMLGTNDSDRFKTWGTADTTKYVSDYTAFVDELTALNPNTQFVMMNCPEYFRGTGADGEFGSDRMVSIQKTLFETYKDEGRNVSFFDMHTFTASDEMGSEMFYDGLHPSNPGYVVMANRICDMLLALADDTVTDPLLIK